MGWGDLSGGDDIGICPYSHWGCTMLGVQLGTRHPLRIIGGLVEDGSLLLVSDDDLLAEDEVELS